MELVLQALVYFFVSLGATTVGATTGMGGGVIIKPVLDVLGDYDVATIGMLSCITVLVMSVVSVGKQIRQKTRFPVRMSVLLAVSSVVGGSLGVHVLDGMIAAVGSNSRVLVYQNICLGLLILIVYCYMLMKDKLPTLGQDGTVPVLLVGVMLGFFSSFLGIGGGPINVAILMFVFSFGIKTATVCSIVTILAAQVSKLVSTAVSTGFALFDFSMLPVMVIGAVLGGFIGAVLNRALPDRMVEKGFNTVQLVVLGICVLNIARNLG